MDNDKEIREIVNDLFYIKEDYEGCLKKCKEYLLLKGLERRTIYIINLLISQCYNQFNDVRNSIKYLNTSIRSADGDGEKTVCNWQLGCIYNKVNKKKSLKCFSKCLAYYKTINEYFCMAELLKNLGILYDSEVYLKQALESYKIPSNEDYINKYLTTKDDCLIDCYIAIVKYYIKTNQKQQVFKMINDIGDKYIKTELRKELPGLLSEDQVV